MGSPRFLEGKNLSLAELARLPHWVSRDGRKWRMCCPLHGGHNPTAFSVEVASGLYHCFACQAGGQLRDGLLLVSRIKPATSTSLSARPRRLEKLNLNAGSRWLARMRQAQTRLYNAVSRPGSRTARSVLAYLQQRGISYATALKAGIGYEPDFSFSRVEKTGETNPTHRISVPALLFPLYHPLTGEFLNFYARGISGNNLRLHYTGRGSKGLFHASAIKQTGNGNPYQPLLIVEGVFDALGCMEAGYRRVVALTGTSLLNPAWFEGTGSEVILAFDRDDAGQLAQEKARRELTGRGISCTFLPESFFAGYKDLGEYGQAARDEFRAKLRRVAHKDGE